MSNTARKRKVHYRKRYHYSQRVSLTLCGKWEDDYSPWLTITDNPKDVTCEACRKALKKQGLLPEE